MHEDVLRALARAMAHRGPDGEGFYTDNDRGPSIGLVNRRLAIIDVAGGTQPMSTDDGRHTIVYNGELYNAAELRSELASRGHRFRTLCDTEVVLRSIVEWGPDAFTRFNGIWALAAWDSARRSLLLSRDRLGVKPLVYNERQGRLVFASEIPTLLASGVVRPELDVSSLHHYLTFFTVPEPMTMLAGVRRLPAGHYLVAQRGSISEHQYWDCSIEEEPDRGFGTYVDEFSDLITDAVRRQLVSDVPLGVFLSGGLDSALLATIAAEHGGQLRTFSIGFEGATNDERPAAAELARHLGSDHTEEFVSSAEAYEALPGLLAAHGQPTQSLVQTNFAARLAGRDVKVAMSGLGGDELFSSYPTHVAVEALARFDKFPQPVRTAATSVAAFAPIPRARRLAGLAAMSPDDRLARRLIQQVDAPTRTSVLAPALRDGLDPEAPARAVLDVLRRSASADPLNRTLYLYAKTYLPDELLWTTDSMSMRHSLEARVPLLDHRIVEAAMRMPARHKMHRGQGKLVLREVGRRLLPDGWVDRPKVGFSLPVDSWMHGVVGRYVGDVLAGSDLRERGVFDPRAVRQILSGFVGGDSQQSQLVMMILSFELWARQTLSIRPSADEARTAVRSVPERTPELSVIIVNWNTESLLRQCLASVASHLGDRAEVIVVDNASSDGSVAMVAAEFPSVRVIANEENVGFGTASNQAMRVARCHWFLLLNSDAQLLDDTPLALMKRFEHEHDVGVVHCKMVGDDGAVQYSTYRFPSLARAVLEDFGFYRLLPRSRQGQLLLAGYWDHDSERDVDWVAAAFMLVRRKVFDDTDGFDEDIFMYGEDMEWGYRIRDAGWRVRYVPDRVVLHSNHKSAEIRWGDAGRVELCLTQEQRVYRRRVGEARRRMYAVSRLIGATLRLSYYTLRCRVTRNANYEPFLQHARTSMPVLKKLALSRS